MENQNLQNPQGKQKSKYWKFIFGFLGIVIITVGGFFVWDKYFSPSAKSKHQMEKQYEAYTQWEERYKQAMREDTYGGKTPEETLQMFIEALKKEDIELASKYFMLDTNEQPYNAENYLTRNKWEEGLGKAKKEGKLVEIVNTISKAVPDPEAAISKDYFVFAVRDETGIVIADVDLRLNKESGVWKISSL